MGYLSGLFERWRSSSRDSDNAIEAIASPLEKTHASLIRLRKKGWSSYSVVKAQDTQLSVYYASLSQYLSLLKEFKACVARSQMIGRGKYTGGIKNTTLDDIFKTPEGTHYLPRDESIEHFLTLSIELVELMRQTQDSEAGPDEYNQRMLVLFIKDIFNIAQSIWRACDTSKRSK